MILLEIPKLTLEHELNELNRVEETEYPALYVQGAKDALHWLLGHTNAPHEIVRGIATPLKAH